MNINCRHILYIAVGTIVILLIPLVAMQFTDEVMWTVSDFIVAGTLLFVAGLALEFAKAKLTNPVHRVIAVILIVLAFLLTWAELAVGIFGTLWAGS